MASGDLKIHPVCELFPEMTADEYAKLKASISQHGVRIPISVKDGWVIDGKHRLRACGELGIECPQAELDGLDESDLILFALAANSDRRHMTPSQRAMVAQKSLPLLEKAASDRQKMGRQTSGPRGPEVVNRARDAAAKAAGASGRSVARAKRVANERPDLAEAVERGEKTLTAAEREITDSDEPAAETPPTDGRDKPVEIKKLWEVFRSEDHADLLSRLRSVRKDVKALCGTPLGAHLNPQQVDADLDNAINAIKFAAPYAPCPYCRAHGCKTCRKQGWVGRALFDSAPKELKDAI